MIASLYWVLFAGSCCEFTHELIWSLQTLRRVLLLVSSVYKWETWCLKRWSELPKSHNPLRTQVGFEPMALWFQRVTSFLYVTMLPLPTLHLRLQLLSGCVTMSSCPGVWVRVRKECLFMLKELSMAWLEIVDFRMMALINLTKWGSRKFIWFLLSSKKH